MIIKSLYESLLSCLNEARVQRTIDKKLWLSIASTCSRNRATEAENIKPSPSATKEQLLPRYIAALLIMKKPCPTSEQDMDDIKTFKLVGKKLLQLGCTIEEIQNEYVANGGKIITKEVNANPQQVEQKLESDIKKPVEQQVQKPVIPVKQAKPKIELPEGIKSYEEMLEYVQENYNSMIEVAQAIYDILDKTYYTIQKTFYKVQRKDFKLYFKGVTTNELKKLFSNDIHTIYIDWVKTKKTRVFTGSLCVVANDLSVNGERISNKNIELDNSTDITVNELDEMLQIILAKLMYRQQGEYIHPDHINKPKKSQRSLGTFGTKRRSFDEPVDTKEFAKILRLVHKKYNYKQARTFIETMIAEGYGTGNKEFMFDNSMFDIRTTDGIYELRGYKDSKLMFYSRNYGGISHCYGWTIPNNPNEMYEISWNTKAKAKASDIKECFYIILANILYFANNYSNLENSEIKFK